MLLRKDTPRQSNHDTSAMSCRFGGKDWINFQRHIAQRVPPGCQYYEQGDYSANQGSK